MLVWFELPLLSPGAVDDLDEVVFGGILRDTTLTKTHTLLCVCVYVRT